MDDGGQRRGGGRRSGFGHRLALAMLLVAAVGLATLPASPSQARLLGTVKKTTTTVTKTVESTVEVVDDTVKGTTTLLGDLTEEALAELTGWLYTDAATTMDHVAAVVGADGLWELGYTGQGVGVALLDTGVVPVEGLTSGNVVNGPDLSFESQSADLRYLDTFGHGTHMAGILAGRDGPDGFQGIAPDATLVNVKLASYDGAVDVSQVIAAIDWVVQHRDEHDIRVLNLSYGTNGVQDYRLDPLTHAVQNAWRHGIVVVVAAGNAGFAPQLNNPAYDPYVIAVGAGDTQGTVAATDDTVPEFSSRGAAGRRPDFVAPGQSIVSLRDPGSFVDVAHPGARVGEHLFKGSGSSQAAAVVAGAVALLLQHRPELSPDQVKQLLAATAQPMPLADAEGSGAGMINVASAALTPALDIRQGWTPSTGLGSLDAARGSNRVADDDVELEGERDLFGPWNPDRWAAASAAGTAWADGVWNGFDWTGDCYCADSWAGRSWSGRSWSGDTWTGRSWSSTDWAGRSWSGRSWSGDEWAGRSWSGRSWSGRSWSGVSDSSGTVLGT